MTEKIDLSLDEIIKLNKKQNNNKPKNNRAAQSKIRPKLQRKTQVAAQSQAHQQIKDVGQTMLHISNLHFKVTDKDLRELFNEIAPTKKAAIHYDKSGRSLGTAEIVFRTRDAAVRALNKYNQRLLDGRVMNITIVPSNNATKPIGIKPGSGINKRSQQPQTNRRSQGSNNRSPRKGNIASSKGNRRGKPAGRQPKKEITSEELDADLEAYSSKMNVD